MSINALNNKKREEKENIGIHTLIAFIVYVEVV